MLIDLNQYAKQLLLGFVEELDAQNTHRLAYWAAVRAVPPAKEAELVRMVLQHPLIVEEDLEAMVTHPGPVTYLTPEVVEAFLSHPSASDLLAVKLATFLGRSDEEARSVLRRHRLGNEALVLAETGLALHVLLGFANVLAGARGSADLLTTLCSDRGEFLCWMSEEQLRRAVRDAVLVCRAPSTT